MAEQTAEIEVAPLDRIRAAERLIREWATAATPGPGESYHDTHAEVIVCEAGRRGFGAISNPATGRADYGRGNAEHIAPWDPNVAPAVADWLRSAAADLWAHGPLCCPDGCDECDDALWMPHVRRALVLADRLYRPESEASHG